MSRKISQRKSHNIKTGGRVWRDGQYIEGLKISKIVPQLRMTGYAGRVVGVNRG